MTAFCKYLPLFLFTYFVPHQSQAFTMSNHFYADGALGWSSLASSHVEPYRFKDKRYFGYRLAMGYLFSLNEQVHIGPEVGYGFYGQTSYLNASGLISNYKLDAWTLLMALKYQPTEFLNLYLKGGLSDASQKLNIVGPNVTPGGFYQQDVKPALVAATSYQLTNQAEVMVSYTHIFANKAPLTSNQQFTFTNVNQISSVNAVMIGLVYFV